MTSNLVYILENCLHSYLHNNICCLSLGDGKYVVILPRTIFCVFVC